MSSRLICFDLDGTLIPRTTSSGHLARTLGHAVELEKLEDGYSAGRFGNREVADFDAVPYRGRSVADIHALLDSIEVIDHITEVVAEAHRRDYHAVVATVGWRIVAQWFCNRFGFDSGCGPEIGLDESGRLTGVVSRHFDEFDKLAFVTDEADRLKIPLDRCVAVGDGRSDIPIFEVVGVSIALNGTEAANAAATHRISSRDLRDILPLIP
jgi:phosphoserine phosphatase